MSRDDIQNSVKRRYPEQCHERIRRTRFILKWADTFILKEHCSIGTVQKVGQLRVVQSFRFNAGSVCLHRQTAPQFRSTNGTRVNTVPSLERNAGAVSLPVVILYYRKRNPVPCRVELQSSPWYRRYWCEHSACAMCK